MGGSGLNAGHLPLVQTTNTVRGYVTFFVDLTFTSGGGGEDACGVTGERADMQVSTV